MVLAYAADLTDIRCIDVPLRPSEVQRGSCNSVASAAEAVVGTAIKGMVSTGVTVSKLIRKSLRRNSATSSANSSVTIELGIHNAAAMCISRRRGNPQRSFGMPSAAVSSFRSIDGREILTE